VDFGTSYSMLRDPNSRFLVPLGDPSDPLGEARLPRRLSNSQTFTAATTVDLVRALLALAGESSTAGRLVSGVAGRLRPVDVTYNRSLQSSYDGTPFTPGLGYQLSLGGENAFRRLRGRLASIAGVNAVFAVDGGFALPLGASLAARYQRGATRSWTRLQDTVQRPVDGEAVTFPNVSLRWSYRPPAFLQRVIASVGANATLEETRTTSFAPSVVAGAPAEAGWGVQRRYPLNGSVAWALAGGFSTSASYALSTRDEVRPGIASAGRTRDVAVDVGKTFRVPRSWSIDDRLNTRVSYQQSRTRNVVRDLSAAGLAPRPLADNGRRALNVNADARVSEDVTFSLVASRIANFDDQYNRRFVQTVFTAVLQMQFFAGELR